MRFFPIFDLQHLVLAFFLGLAGALVIFLAFRYGNNSIPPVLVFLFIGFIVWFICYVVFFGFLGGPV